MDRKQDSGLQAGERIDAGVPHRQNQPRHSTHVETHDPELVPTDGRECSSACDDEFQVADLSLEVFDIELHEWSVGPDQGTRRNNKPTTCQLLAHCGKSDRRLVIQALANHNQRDGPGSGSAFSKARTGCSPSASNPSGPSDRARAYREKLSFSRRGLEIPEGHTSSSAIAA